MLAARTWDEKSRRHSSVGRLELRERLLKLCCPYKVRSQRDKQMAVARSVEAGRLVVSMLRKARGV